MKAPKRRSSQKYKDIVERGCGLKYYEDGLSDDMGKYGIKGNTGLGVGGMFHVSAPYDSNGKVFVRVDHPERGEVWERVDADKADTQRVIRCVMCDKPAVSLDHYWPYYSDMNRCAAHHGADFDPENSY